MRKIMAWFAVPAAVALGATWVSAPASAAISPPQTVNVDGGGSDTARTIAVDAAGNAYLGGSIYDIASTTLPTPHYFRGSQAFYTSSPAAAASANIPTAETTALLTGLIPVNAVSWLGNFSVLNATSTVTQSQNVAFRHTPAADYIIHPMTITAAVFASHNFQAVFPNVDQKFQYQGDSTDNSPVVNAYVAGYTNPNGDV